MITWLLTILVALVVALALVLGVFLLGMRASSPLVVNAVRALNRRVVNPRQMKTAGTRGAYGGVIRHVGRRSGRLYETPVGPYRTDDGFVIALPYGTASSWVKNVLAAGSATLVSEGQTYAVSRPEIVPLEQVIDAVPAKERRTHRLFGVEHAMRVRADQSKPNNGGRTTTTAAAQRAKTGR